MKDRTGAFVVDGLTYPVDFSLRAIWRIEKVWGRPAADFPEELDNWGAHGLLCMLLGGLEAARSRGEDVVTKKGKVARVLARPFSIDEIADLAAEGGGVGPLVAQIGEAWVGAQAEPEDTGDGEEGEDGEGKAGSRTGPASSDVEPASD